MEELPDPVWIDGAVGAQAPPKPSSSGIVEEARAEQKRQAQLRADLLAKSRHEAKMLHEQLVTLQNTREQAIAAWGATEDDLRARLQAATAVEQVLDGEADTNDALREKLRAEAGVEAFVRYSEDRPTPPYAG